MLKVTLLAVPLHSADLIFHMMQKAPALYKSEQDPGFLIYIT